MIVRMTTQLVWYGRIVQPGETVDLPERDAMRYIATQQAERLEEPPPPIEAATLRRDVPNMARDFKPKTRR